MLTEHYEIYTTITDERLLATFPELMERTYAFYQEVVPPERPLNARMPIYLFARRPEWAYFTQKFTGPRAAIFLKIRNGGYSERGVTAIQYVSHPATFPLMAHEGLHQYLYHQVHPQVPAWLNEGLATVFEGQRWRGDRLAAFEPNYNPMRQNALAEALLRDELIPLSNLLETNAGRIVGDTGRNVATYYAQVWGLVMYLMEGDNGRYASAFRKMCTSLSEGTADKIPVTLSAAAVARSPGEALFRTHITDDLEQFERDFRAYWRKRLLHARD
jgi:hypothetical protein